MHDVSYVYILGNKQLVLYVGVTSDLEKRMIEHRQERFSGFAKRYGLHKLLYFETFPTIEAAIAREKQLKNWHRAWKLNLIQKTNPVYEDLWLQNSRS